MKLRELLDILKPYEDRHPDGEVLVEIDDSKVLHHLVRTSIEPAKDWRKEVVSEPAQVEIE